MSKVELTTPVQQKVDMPHVGQWGILKSVYSESKAPFRIAFRFSHDAYMLFGKLDSDYTACRVEPFYNCLEIVDRATAAAYLTCDDLQAALAVDYPQEESTVTLTVSPRLAKAIAVVGYHKITGSRDSVRGELDKLTMAIGNALDCMEELDSPQGVRLPGHPHIFFEESFK